MALGNRKPSPGPTPFSIDPGSLPDDGSPVSFEQTFRKKLGDGQGAPNVLTDADVQHSDWQVERIGSDGKWKVLDIVQGRPSPGYMLKRPRGSYRVTPIKDGKLLNQFSEEIDIGEPLAAASQIAVATEQATPSDPTQAFLQVMFQQQAEERTAQARRLEQAEARREAWEREQSLKDEARRDREERMAQARADREAEERRQSADRTNQLIMAGLTALQTVVPSVMRPQAPQEANSRLQEILLNAVLRERSQPTAQGTTLAEQLQMLVALDQVAQARADRLPPASDKPENDDDSLTGMLRSMLPMFMMNRAQTPQQPGVQMQPQQPQIDVEGLVAHALKNPQLIRAAVRRDPKATANTLAALMDDPETRNAVIAAMEEREKEGEE